MDEPPQPGPEPAPAEPARAAHHGGPHEHHEELERWEDAAVEAELETGDREPDVVRARAHIAVRLARMGGAGMLLAIGALLLVLPGPGWLLIAAGFALLAKDVAWADRVLTRVKRRVPGARDDGSLPRSVIVTMVAVSAAFVSLGLFVTLR